MFPPSYTGGPQDVPPPCKPHGRPHPQSLTKAQWIFPPSCMPQSRSHPYLDSRFSRPWFCKVDYTGFIKRVLIARTLMFSRIFQPGCPGTISQVSFSGKEWVQIHFSSKYLFLSVHRSPTFHTSKKNVFVAWIGVDLNNAPNELTKSKPTLYTKMMGIVSN